MATRSLIGLLVAAFVRRASLGWYCGQRKGPMNLAFRRVNWDHCRFIFQSSDGMLGFIDFEKLPFCLFGLGEP